MTVPTAAMRSASSEVAAVRHKWTRILGSLSTGGLPPGVLSLNDAVTKGSGELVVALELLAELLLTSDENSRAE